MASALDTRVPQRLEPAPASFLPPTHHSGSALTRQFALLSLLVIGMSTVALCLIISYYLRQDLLEGEWTLTADAIRTEALDHTLPSDFATPVSAPAQEHF